MGEITVNGISFNVDHFGAMPEAKAIEAILSDVKGLQSAGVKIEIGADDKSKKEWAKKVFDLMTKKEGPAK